MIRLFKTKSFKICILTIFIAIISVVSFSIFNNGKDIKNSQDFIKELKSNGYNVQSDEISIMKDNLFNSSNGHKSIALKNSSHINIYEFETEELAKAAAEMISKDGNRIGRSYINWGTAVKFYRKGNIIVQYDGTDFKAIWHLRNIMGKSVASSPIDFFLYKKIFKSN